jgi:hypothetical protein
MKVSRDSHDAGEPEDAEPLRAPPDLERRQQVRDPDDQIRLDREVTEDVKTRPPGGRKEAVLVTGRDQDSNEDTGEDRRSGEPEPNPRGA